MQSTKNCFHPFIILVTDPVDLEQVKWVRVDTDDAELEDLYVDGKTISIVVMRYSKQ